MALATILLLLAILCFVLAAFGVSSRVSLTDIGLALFAASFMAGNMAL